MTTKKLSFILIISIVLTLGLSISMQSLLAAWTAPTATPPDANIGAPINTSATGQAKQGGLILNTAGGTNALIVQFGNVGIGTTDPDKKLTLRSTTTTQDNYLKMYGWYSGYNNRYFEIFRGNAGTNLTSSGDGGYNYFAINMRRTDTSDNQLDYKTAIYIDGTTANLGNVGIGTVAPVFPFEVKNAGLNYYGNLYSIAAFRDADADKGLVLGYDTTASKTFFWSADASGYTTPTAFGFWTADGSAWGERMTINAGNVGIGTTDPKTKLDVAGPVKVGNYTTAGRPACDANLLGSFIFDTTENKPYVCTSGGIWKPLDSDYDKDGIVDWNDWDDTDPDMKSPNLIAENIRSGVIILGVTGNYSAPTLCGNTIVEYPPEACDDGNTSWTAGNCAADCSKINYWSRPQRAGYGICWWSACLNQYCREQSPPLNLYATYSTSVTAGSVFYTSYMAPFTTTLRTALCPRHPSTFRSLHITNYYSSYYSTACNRFAYPDNTTWAPADYCPSTLTGWPYSYSYTNYTAQAFTCGGVYVTYTETYIASQEKTVYASWYFWSYLGTSEIWCTD